MSKFETDICQAAAVRLTLRFPFWTEIFYSMTIREGTAEEGINTLATDGRNLWVNREFFTKLPLDQQVGVLVHELAHKIFLHPTRRGHRDPELWNIAADLVINAMIKDNGLQLPPEGLYDPKYAGWLAEAVYADLLQQQKQQQGGQGSGGQGQQGQGIPQLPKGWNDLRAPTGTPEEISRLEDETKALVDRAVANAKAMGKLPAGIDAGLVANHKPLQEPWHSHLQRFMQSLSLSEYNWAKLNRRALKTHGLFAPLHYSESLGDVVLFIDTSGSCFDKAQQANFTGHLNAILAEARPRKLHVFYFDTKVYPGETIEAGELDITTRPKGGGGTDFRPLFAALDEEGIEPEVAIVLTDLYGPFGEAPDFPVVWAATEPLTAPFGETIHIEV